MENEQNWTSLIFDKKKINLRFQTISEIRVIIS